MIKKTVNKQPVGRKEAQSKIRDKKKWWKVEKGRGFNKNQMA